MWNIGRVWTNTSPGLARAPARLTTHRAYTARFDEHCALRPAGRARRVEDRARRAACEGVAAAGSAWPRQRVVVAVAVARRPEVRSPGDAELLRRRPRTPGPWMSRRAAAVTARCSRARGPRAGSSAARGWRRRSGRHLDLEVLELVLASSATRSPGRCPVPAARRRAGPPRPSTSAKVSRRALDHGRRSGKRLAGLRKRSGTCTASLLRSSEPRSRRQCDARRARA